MNLAVIDFSPPIAKVDYTSKFHIMSNELQKPTTKLRGLGFQSNFGIEICIDESLMQKPSGLKPYKDYVSVS